MNLKVAVELCAKSEAIVQKGVKVGAGGQTQGVSSNLYRYYNADADILFLLSARDCSPIWKSVSGRTQAGICEHLYEFIKNGVFSFVNLT